MGESNPTIVYLELDGNEDISPELEQEVISILKPRGDAFESEPETDDELESNGSESEVDEVEQLMERVRNNDPTLTELNLSSMGIGTRSDALTMFDTLAGNSYIQSVDLSQNEVDDDCVSSISLALLDNKSVMYLNLADNAIYSEGAEYLINTLNGNETLQEINLSGNHVDNSVIDEIEVILNERQGSSSMESSLKIIVRSLAANDLNLDGIDLERSSDTDAMIDALAKNKVVTKLSFNNTYADDILVEALSLAPTNNRTITHISLKDNEITSEGCEYLLGMLASNLSIISLDLGGNMVDEDLMEAIDAIVSQREPQLGNSSTSNEMSLSVLLQRVIGNDRTLTQLELDNRPHDMMSHEIGAIIEGLSHNNFVTEISLCNNQITSDGCEYLLGTLDSNETIIYLDLSGNLIEEHLMNEIDEIMSQRQNRARLPQIV